MMASAPGTITAPSAAETRAVSDMPHPEFDSGDRRLPAKGVRSAFVLAALSFIVLSAVCAANRFGQNKPADFPFMGWTAWAIQDYLTKPEAPNVAFLGSSLMLVPLAGVDADYLNRRLDGAQHHHSAYFEDNFKRATGVKIDTFNFALPGEMPSDAFMITDFILGKKRPNVVVYGVGPRDFTDNLLPSPASTDPFRFLSRFKDVSPNASLLMPDWQERFSFELGKLFYLYGQRTDLVRNFMDLSNSTLGPVVALPPGTKPISEDDRHLLIPEYMPTELKKNTAFFRPTTPAERTNFADNLAEYKRRYAKLKKQTFETQLAFFKKGLTSAKLSGIHPVIIAMPITDLNRQLLPDSTWNLYRGAVRDAAQAEGATFIDLSESPDFVRGDFSDTVHLHSGGGQKLLDKVIAAMAADKKVMSVINIRPASRYQAQSNSQGGGCAAN